MINMMNLYLFALKTNYTNKFFIPKICENSPFLKNSSAHLMREKSQVTFTYKKNSGNFLQDTIMMNYDELK